MFKSRCKISFEGLNLNRTLNKLAEKYTLYDVTRQGKNCQITVSSRVYRQVVAFLREKCYNITNIQQIGLSSVRTFFKAHWLLPVYLLLVVAILALSANFCLRIEVTGDYDSKTVISAMKQLHVGVGSNLFKFNPDDLENKLSVKLDAMYAVVNRKGSTLYINAVKRKEVDTPIDMHTRRDVVATCDGKVTSVLCEQGTAVCKVGDYVKAGDVLIQGLRTFSDGTTESVYAMGRVTLEQSCTAFAEFSGVATETVETGKTFTADYVMLFGKSYGKMPPFETFRTERETVSLSPLNLKIDRVTYYETQQVTKTVTLEECLDSLKQIALQQVLRDAPFSVTYTEYRVTQSGVYATAYGVAEMK